MALSFEVAGPNEPGGLNFQSVAPSYEPKPYGDMATTLFPHGAEVQFDGTGLPIAEIRPRYPSLRACSLLGKAIGRVVRAQGYEDRDHDLVVMEALQEY